MDISTLSFVDTVNIIANFHNIYYGKTKTTSSDLKARGYNEETIKVLSKNVQSLAIESCGVRIKGDVSKLSYEFFDHVMHLFDGYEKGILPFEGSLSDQPAQIMQIFTLVNLLKLEHKKFLHEEQKKLEKKSGRKR